VIVLLQAYLDGQVSCHEREGVKSALSSCLSSAISGDASTRFKMRSDPYNILPVPTESYSLSDSILGNQYSLVGQASRLSA
jgi:hypothetical protein